MKIIDALKPTGKATMPHLSTNYVAVDDDDVLRYFGINTKFAGRVVSYKHIICDDWQPYHEVKEIRPKEPGETWYEVTRDLKCFTFSNAALGLAMMDERGVIITIPEYMVHGKNGFTRVDPPVKEDSVKNNSHVRIITDEEIDVISDVLHESIQFYNSKGEKNNEKVIGLIAKVLAEMTREAT